MQHLLTHKFIHTWTRDDQSTEKRKTWEVMLVPAINIHNNTVARPLNSLRCE
jgi:hypothetical protein